MSDLRERITAAMPATRADLERLVRIPSIAFTGFPPEPVLEAAEATAEILRSTGLPEERILMTGMAIFSALHGFVSLEVSGYFGGVDDLDAVFAQVIRGAVTAAVLEATQPAGATA